MKIKRVEAICKSDKRIYLYEGDSIQWIGNGVAFYPLHNMPILDEKTIFTLFEIAEKDREKYQLRTEPLPVAVNFNDYTETEVLMDCFPITLSVQGLNVIPYKGSSGIIFVETRYLTPFAKQDPGFELYERFTTYGTPYIAVKRGLFLIGIISPCDLINLQFINDLDCITALSRIALQDSNIKRRVENEED